MANILEKNLPYQTPFFELEKCYHLVLQSVYKVLTVIQKFISFEKVFFIEKKS